MRWRSTNPAPFPTCATGSNPYTGVSSTPCTRWGFITRKRTASARVSSATFWVNFTRTAIRPCTMRSCVWRRISPSTSRLSTGTATSVRWTAIRPRQCDTPRRAFQSSPRKCCAISIRRRWTSSPISTETRWSLPCSRRDSPIFSSTGRTASPSAWRRISRRTTSPRSSTARSRSSTIPRSLSTNS